MHHEFKSEPTPDDAVKGTSFEALSEEDLEVHLRIKKYGSFELTGAVFPAYDLSVKPEEGYRFQSDGGISFIVAAVSAPRLLETFYRLIEVPLASMPYDADLNLLLKTSFGDGTVGRYLAEDIDPQMLKARLSDYTELLLEDGCSGISLRLSNGSWILDFEEHKLLLVIGDFLDESVEVLESLGVRMKEDLQTVADAEHIHSSKHSFAEQFERLCEDFEAEEVVLVTAEEEELEPEPDDESF